MQLGAIPFFRAQIWTMNAVRDVYRTFMLDKLLTSKDVYNSMDRTSQE